MAKHFPENDPSGGQSRSEWRIPEEPPAPIKFFSNATYTIHAFLQNVRAHLHFAYNNRERSAGSEAVSELERWELKCIKALQERTSTAPLYVKFRKTEDATGWEIYFTTQE